MPKPSILPVPNRFQYAPSFIGMYHHLFVEIIYNVWHDVYSLRLYYRRFTYFSVCSAYLYKVTWWRPAGDSPRARSTRTRLRLTVPSGRYCTHFCCHHWVDFLWTGISYSNVLKLERRFGSHLLCTLVCCTLLSACNSRLFINCVHRNIVSLSFRRHIHCRNVC